ncbi:PAP/OAS1 substrate-binding domain superfamily protein [Melia azedarach]|uniref:PAP/OAS1 substrate-binding domain superfamily protein n=1 Tax=Melia azedarach TaxID=155640 RepID=A0ACC1Y7I9_MELAZ|nr:PAP/OAS1 substrate-binding domain superfamily protein [Melia azedarach]
MGDVQVCSVSFESLIARESWETAEGITNEILCRIRPTLVADDNRREVIKYVRDLITASLGCEVFPYGSVPLKTYLPDGDIDLTAISTPNIEDTLVSDVHAVLKGEEYNKSARFKVKDVHYIDAEVKLVKCLVQNIVVDISFNQLGGLSALCFLELVDGNIGKDHLFKRSIILIKAWCYYESRILGAHHGLISTYALETLVLYIFHLFHSSLDGPLAVLHRFLDYFSKFDWENYCVSLNGPVCKSSLPDIVAKGQENGRDGLLLSEEFLQECLEKFSVPSRGMETNLRAFPQKHLNIVDALKENNNLGRSVNRGNSYRIRSAFKYGARKLGEILMLPNQRLADELRKFFGNTLERHGNEYRTDLQDFALVANGSSGDCLVSTQHSGRCDEEGVLLESSNVGNRNDKTAEFRNNKRKNSLKVISPQAMPELNCTFDRNSVSRSHNAGDAKDIAAGILSCRNRDDSSGCLPLRSDFGTSLQGKSQQQIENGSPPGRIRRRATAAADTALLPESKENSSICSYNKYENITPKSSVSISDRSESSKSLLDLYGHYERYFNNLTYAKHYHLSAPVLSSPTMSYQLQDSNFWETICGSLQLEPKFCFKMNASGSLGTQFYPVNPVTPSTAALSSEDKKQSRGTGTYFPKMNFRPNDKMPLSGRGRCQAQRAYGQRHTHRNGSVTTPIEVVLPGEVSHELSEEEFPILGNGKSSFQHQSSVWVSSKSNDLFHPVETYDFQLSEVPLPEVTTQLASLWSDSAESPSPVSESNQESNAGAEESFHLGNEVDFPPLTLQERIKT